MASKPNPSFGPKDIALLVVLTVLALVVFSVVWRIFSLFIAASLLVLFGVAVSRWLLGVSLSSTADARMSADRDPTSEEFEARMRALDEEMEALDRVIEDR